MPFLLYKSLLILCSQLHSISWVGYYRFMMGIHWWALANLSSWREIIQSEWISACFRFKPSPSWLQATGPAPPSLGRQVPERTFSFIHQRQQYNPHRECQITKIKWGWHWIELLSSHQVTGESHGSLIQLSTSHSLCRQSIRAVFVPQQPPLLTPYKTPFVRPLLTYMSEPNFF